MADRFPSSSAARIQTRAAIDRDRSHNAANSRENAHERRPNTGFVRWTVGWLTLIVLMTLVMFWSSNAFIAQSGGADTPLAMRALGGGGLGSSVCTQAARDLVAAGDGSAPTASADQQASFERASNNVLQACSAS